MEALSLCPHTAIEPDLQRIEDEIAEIAAHIQAATCRLLELLREFDERGGWHGDGIKSCAHWLNWRCGIGLNAAREKLRVAHALAELPRTSELFRKGELSYSKVRAITRAATEDTEEHFLNIATNGTASHVERLVRYYRRTERLHANEAEEAPRQAREFDWYTDHDGCFVFRGRLPPEQGALIEKALNAAFDLIDSEQGNDGLAPRDPNNEVDDRPPMTARRADALERIAQAFLAGEYGKRTGGDRYTVHLHTDADTLSEDGTGAESELEGCGCVSAETSRRMACDAGVIHHLNGSDGTPLNVGRRTRTVPPALRRALERRDHHGCRFPGCTSTRYLDAHHIQHWADGGETNLENLTLLCTYHHRLVHEGGFGVTGNANEALTFTRPDGTVIPETGHESGERRYRGNVQTLIDQNELAGLDLHRLSLHPHWLGERMDYDLVLQNVFMLEHQAVNDEKVPR